MNEPVEKEYTPEEIAEMRNNMEKHIDQQTPLLEKQAKYERLLADIEIAKVERITASYQLYQIEQQQEKAKQEEKKLKKDVKD